jgi:DNA repair exonuclease SbcCD ATPase subunit
MLTGAISAELEMLMKSIVQERANRAAKDRRIADLERQVGRLTGEWRLLNESAEQSRAEALKAIQDVALARAQLAQNQFSYKALLKAQAERDRLRAELAEIKTGLVDKIQPDCRRFLDMRIHNQREELARLTRELAEARRDTERLVKFVAHWVPEIADKDLDAIGSAIMDGDPDKFRLAVDREYAPGAERQDEVKKEE